MTNKDAIERINHLIDLLKSPRTIMPYCKEELHALNLAIEALEEKDLREKMKKLYYQELRKEAAKNDKQGSD